jgi:hypothetical protein
MKQKNKVNPVKAEMVAKPIKKFIKSNEIEKEISEYEEGDSADRAFDINKKGFFDLIGNMKNFYFRTKARRTFLVNIELFNGKHVQRVVVVKNKIFKYNDGFYIIDDSAKYENLSAEMWSLDYHEGIAIPIKRKISYNSLRDTMETSGIDIENAIDPQNLKQFIEGQVIEKIMKGEELDSLFRLLKWVTIANLLIAIVHLVLFAQKSGMFQATGVGV